MIKRIVAFIVLAMVFGTPLAAAPLDPATAMQWRMIGPFRGGRTVAVVGVHRAGTDRLYIGVTNGGVWRSDDLGRTWQPIFDAQPTQSIGAVAVAPSDPNVVYVGSGEGLQRPDLSVGDGIYRSADGGDTWQHLGLRDAQQIGAIAVDPRDPNRLYVAALGHPYGPNSERGVYRSTDGGTTFTRVLFKDENTGAIAVSIDPVASDTLYASLWTARSPVWNLSGSTELPGSGLFKSTDGGTTWRELTAGLPPSRGRIGLSVSLVDHQRLYAWVEAQADDATGIYRSDDGGEHWMRTNHEERVAGRGQDFAGITADPTERDTVYVANTSTYRSTDGGATFTAIKGAPGGDDYHTVWIDPHNHDVIALAVDQGATVSADRGATWSSWYNQPTAQFYHVITDDRFPYRVFGGQQESGSAEVLSRGDAGAVTFADWHPIGVEEYGYVAPDPLHPWLIYGGKATVYDERTKQTREVGPEPVRLGAYRYVRTMPLIFSHVDPHRLYLGLNKVLETRDGGMHWREISPDLARRDPGYPTTFGPFAGHEPEPKPHLGVVYALAPAYLDVKTIWAGTDDGTVHMTSDGGTHWSDVTPPAMHAWDKVMQIDGGRFDANTAYVAMSRLKLDDLHPYIYRTHDGGRSWTPITNGIPDNEPLNAVREDPVRRGLLYAATERSVYASFDDGAHWSSLRLNLPATSIRDIVVHGDDLVVGTHGRSFWILDDVTPLRQLASFATPAVPSLVRPQVATRVRFSTWPDTPLPPEEPVGANPPDGAIIDYALPAAATSVALEIRDSSGQLVRRYASDDPAPLVPSLDKPTYWLRPFERPATDAGIHRFTWDLHETPPSLSDTDLPISAILHNTPLEPRGAIVAPGSYRVRLIVDGKTMEQPLVVRMDPRVAASPVALRAQHDLATRVLRSVTAAVAKKNVRLLARYVQLYFAVEGSDDGPTPAMIATAGKLDAIAAGRISLTEEQWQRLATDEP